MTDTPYLLRSADAAAYLGVSERQLKRWVAERRITYIQLSQRMIRFRVSDLQAFVDGQMGEVDSND